MSRATPAEVKAINGSTLDDAIVQTYLDVADILITAASVCAGVDDETLKQAEIYLTCHLMLGATTGGGSGSGAIVSQSIDTMKVTYASGGGTENGIKSTNYGNIADMLMHGCLSKQQQSKSVILFDGGA